MIIWLDRGANLQLFDGVGFWIQSLENSESPALAAPREGPNGVEIHSHLLVRVSGDDSRCEPIQPSTRVFQDLKLSNPSIPIFASNFLRPQGLSDSSDYLVG